MQKRHLVCFYLFPVWQSLSDGSCLAFLLESSSQELDFISHVFIPPGSPQLKNFFRLPCHRLSQQLFLGAHSSSHWVFKQRFCTLSYRDDRLEVQAALESALRTLVPKELEGFTHHPGGREIASAMPQTSVLHCFAKVITSLALLVLDRSCECNGNRCKQVPFWGTRRVPEGGQRLSRVSFLPDSCLWKNKIESTLHYWIRSPAILYRKIF